MRLLALALALGLVTLAAPGSAAAHEVRPAYLELREEAPGEFRVLWKTPARGEMRLSLAPELSGRTEALAPVATRQTRDASVQTWRLRALDPLGGQTLTIRGLEGTITDALVRIEFAGGGTWVRRLTPKEPGATIPASPPAASVARVYLALGVEHILLGVDHLLFVLALLLVTRGAARLVKTVTAFTVAHSVTLALAALGVVHVPPAPVEAVIALSIVFVAGEAVRARRAGPGAAEGLTARAPWIVAFTFGLLHGFGFAGALSEIGLPPGHVPLALLFFNLGVEAGQLMFVAAALGAVALVRRIGPAIPERAALVPPYAIGTAGVFWMVQRLAAF